MAVTRAYLRLGITHLKCNQQAVVISPSRYRHKGDGQWAHEGLESSQASTRRTGPEN